MLNEPYSRASRFGVRERDPRPGRDRDRHGVPEQLRGPAARDRPGERISLRPGGEAQGKLLEVQPWRPRRRLASVRGEAGQQPDQVDGAVPLQAAGEDPALSRVVDRPGVLGAEGEHRLRQARGPRPGEHELRLDAAGQRALIRRDGQLERGQAELDVAEQRHPEVVHLDRGAGVEGLRMRVAAELQRGDPRVRARAGHAEEEEQQLVEGDLALGEPALHGPAGEDRGQFEGEQRLVRAAPLRGEDPVQLGGGRRGPGAAHRAAQLRLSDVHQAEEGPCGVGGQRLPVPERGPAHAQVAHAQERDRRGPGPFRDEGGRDAVEARAAGGHRRVERGLQLGDPEAGQHVEARDQAQVRRLHAEDLGDRAQPVADARGVLPELGGQLPLAGCREQGHGGLAARRTGSAQMQVGAAEQGGVLLALILLVLGRGPDERTQNEREAAQRDRFEHQVRAQRDGGQLQLGRLGGARREHDRAVRGQRPGREEGLVGPQHRGGRERAGQVQPRLGLRLSLGLGRGGEHRVAQRQARQERGLVVDVPALAGDGRAGQHRERRPEGPPGALHGECEHEPVAALRRRILQPRLDRNDVGGRGAGHAEGTGRDEVDHSAVRLGEIRARQRERRLEAQHAQGRQQPGQRLLVPARGRGQVDRGGVRDRGVQRGVHGLGPGRAAGPPSLDGHSSSRRRPRPDACRAAAAARRPVIPAAGRATAIGRADIGAGCRRSAGSVPAVTGAESAAGRAPARNA
ncbi:MAG TPA: hypothetical protein VFU73_01620 [Actinocrinis sp.]|nr:hypothetical protein [Actinocrinis sp.]